MLDGPLPCAFDGPLPRSSPGPRLLKDAVGLGRPLLPDGSAESEAEPLGERVGGLVDVVGPAPDPPPVGLALPDPLPLGV
ncbi:MAG TPA: hypothetical protein VHO01_00515, partial [Jatrophihabitans sp.]|nr:hypothetical protein [Jatrophihabitans sp.]